jgi:hypothetical protein
MNLAGAKLIDIRKKTVIGLGSPGVTAGVK